MRRLIVMGEHIVPAAKLLFADSDRYTPQQMAQWSELEITVQEDGSYAVWVNLIDDADLLQDRRADHTGMIERLLPYADKIIEDKATAFDE